MEQTVYRSPPPTRQHVKPLLVPAAPVYRSPAAEKVVAHLPRPKEQIRPEGRIEIPFMDGVVLVGSDPHYWPDQHTTAHRAFVKFARVHRPDIIIMNGDVFDGAGVSAFPPINWEKLPTVAEQLEVSRERLRDIELAAPFARRIWPLGNHDARFEKRLAERAPEYADVTGVHLKDHITAWEPCWDVYLGDELVVKHRFRGGIHAAHNNTLWAGRSIATGHLHRLKVHPHTDSNGTRYGIETGTLSDKNYPNYAYTENNPLNWQEGFVLLTFRGGKMLPPEVVPVVAPGVVAFRGEEIEV